MIFKGYPKLVVTSRANLASYMSGPFFTRRIAFGKWHIKNEYEELVDMEDFELALTAIKEETLHYVLEKEISFDACLRFDKLTSEVRWFLQE